VGYGRSARIISQLEKAGVIGPKNGTKPRDVLVSSLDDIE
jgi:S-DNA-T family DNA segregation ATPase FtsK/SpoIIIE